MTTAIRPAHDFETIGVIGFVHGVSHFFQLLLPPLFPWLMQAFDLSFTEIGAATTFLFVVSGMGQASAGFLVDRFGPARVLGGGLCCFLLASLTLHFADSYSALLAAAALVGLGNSVFHPADFTVLNRRVSTHRLGHAFSVHGLSGSLGYAAAPIYLTAIAAGHGWRTAALAAGGVAIVALTLLYWRHPAIADHEPPLAGAPSEAPRSQFAFLQVPAVWLCFLFFLLITGAFGAIQNFVTPILQALYHLTLTQAALALSTYLASGAVGMVLGGFLAQKMHMTA